MRIGDILQKIAIVAVPVVAGAVAGPEVAAVTVAALGAGGAAKLHGKSVERRGGRPHHKVTAPLAAVGASVGIGSTVGPESIERLCGAVQAALDAACANPLLLLAIPGVYAVLSHQTVGNLRKSTRKR